MLVFEENARKETLMEVAKKMMVAARTAPKGKGVDNLVIATVEGDTIDLIANKMKEMVSDGLAPEFFVRDANNILASEAVVIIGTKIKPLGLKYCGLCGFIDCEEKSKKPNHPCVFNTGDLGIAIGSAVSIASEFKVDNRVMYSVGKAVKEMNLLDDEVKIVYGIPLSASGKSPFFDRKKYI